MQPSVHTIGHCHRFRKGFEIALWLMLECCAKWVLAHPSRKVRAAQRRRIPVHSEAYKKAPLQHYRAWISTADRN
jgi:hypothetical protein